MPGRLKRNLTYKLGSTGHLYTRIQDIRNTKNVDVLILGSSHAYRGYDIRIFKEFGLNAFNLGSSGQTPLQTEVLLKRYLDELNPKFIICDIYPLMFESDGVESSLNVISNDENDIESIKLAFENNHVNVYNTLIYSFYRDIFKMNNNYKEELAKDDDKYISGGFVEKKLKYFKYMKYDQSQWKFNEQQFQAFERVLSLIKKRNIPFVLVQAPMTPLKYNSYSNNNDFDLRIKKYGEYYNFNEIVKLDDKIYFYDYDHLNQNGVKVFNAKLIKSLLDEYELLNEKAVRNSKNTNSFKK